MKFDEIIESKKAVEYLEKYWLVKQYLKSKKIYYLD